VAVGREAGGLYILHAAAWNKGHMATYVIRYADGAEARIPVRANQELENWWTPKHGKSYRAALRVSNAECPDVGMLLFGWTNPSPEKAIQNLEFRSENGVGVPVIAAVTLSSGPATLPDAKALAKQKPDAGTAGLAEGGAIEALLAAMHTRRAEAELKRPGRPSPSSAMMRSPCSMRWRSSPPSRRRPSGPSCSSGSPGATKRQAGSGGAAR
jgi:hypothetical protein